MKKIISGKNIHGKTLQRKDMQGFSMTELIIVLVVIAILSAISIPYIYNYTKLYRSEDQSLRIIDLMREANQLALTKRRTFRFELDLTDNKILIIDENGVGAADDTEIKAIPMAATGELRIDTSPAGIAKPVPPNYNDAVFAKDTIGHKTGNSTITGHNVWAAKFKSNGSMVKADGTLVSATIYVWAPTSPGSNNARSAKEVRAITIFGGSGAVRYWKHDGTKFQPY